MGTFKTTPSVDVFMTFQAYAKQQALIQSCPAEVGWFGEVRMHKIPGYGEVYYVTDIYVPEQTVSVGSVDQIGDELLRWMMQNPELASRCNYYGHSHVTAETFTSYTDLTQILNWREYGVPYMINYVGNKHGEHWTRLDQFEPREGSSSVNLIIDVPDNYRAWARDVLAEGITITQTRKGRTEIVKPRGSYAHLS